MNQGEFHDIERTLSQLAERDRGLPSRDFEARMLNTVLGVTNAAALPPSATSRESFALLRTPMKMAASIAIVGAVAAALLANRNSHHQDHSDSVASMMSDVETMLAIAAELDEGNADELSMIHSQATTLSEKVRGGLSDLIDEGAM